MNIVGLAVVVSNVALVHLLLASLLNRSYLLYSPEMRLLLSGRNVSVLKHRAYVLPIY